MATKLKQTRLFDCVLEACPSGKGQGRDITSYDKVEAVLKDYSILVPNRFWAIQHYADFNEKGEIERMHWHLVLEYQTRKTFTGVIRDLADVFFISENRISCEPAKSKISCVRYLMHLDNPEKAVYCPSDIITNDYPYLVEAMSRPMDELTIKDVLEIIDSSGNRIEVMEKIGLKNAQRYRGVINDIYNAKKVKG